MKVMLCVCVYGILDNNLVMLVMISWNMVSLY